MHNKLLPGPPAQTHYGEAESKSRFGCQISQPLKCPESSVEIIQLLNVISGVAFLIATELIDPNDESHDVEQFDEIEQL